MNIHTDCVSTVSLLLGELGQLVAGDWEELLDADEDERRGRRRHRLVGCR